MQVAEVSLSDIKAAITPAGTTAPVAEVSLADIKAAITPVAEVSLSDIKAAITPAGTTAPVFALDAFRALDVKLRDYAAQRFLLVKDKFFDRSFGCVAPLPGGIEAWTGFNVRFRPIHNALALNLVEYLAVGSFGSRVAPFPGGIEVWTGFSVRYVVTACMVQPIPVLDLLGSLLNRNPPDRLSDADRIRLKGILRNMRVEGKPSGQKHKVYDLTREGAADLSVEEYYQRQHGITLRFPHLPCISASNRPNRPCWVPLEVRHRVRSVVQSGAECGRVRQSAAECNVQAGGCTEVPAPADTYDAFIYQPVSASYLCVCISPHPLPPPLSHQLCSVVDAQRYLRQLTPLCSVVDAQRYLRQLTPQQVAATAVHMCSKSSYLCACASPSPSLPSSPHQLCSVVDAQRYLRQLTPQQVAATAVHMCSNSSYLCACASPFPSLPSPPHQLCSVVDAQRYLRQLTPQQVAAIGNLRLKPDKRRGDIANAVGAAGLANNPLLEAFGMRIQPNMMQADGRQLEPPVVSTLVVLVLQFGEKGSMQPRDGQWNMNDKRMFAPAKIATWAVVCFDHRVRDPMQVATALKDCCARKGLSKPKELVSAQTLHSLFSSSIQLVLWCARRSTPPQSASFSHCLSQVIESRPEVIVEDTRREAPEKLVERVIARLKQSKPAFILWILEVRKTSPLYAPIKKLFDTRVGVPTQSYHRPSYPLSPHPPCALGGDFRGASEVATVPAIPSLPTPPCALEGTSEVATVPAIPSLPTPHVLWKVVASMDPEASKYAVRRRAQHRRQETILGLFDSESANGGMLCELMNDFGTINKTAPKRIIVFRLLRLCFCGMCFLSKLNSHFVSPASLLLSCLVSSHPCSPLLPALISFLLSSPAYSSPHRDGISESQFPTVGAAELQAFRKVRRDADGWMNGGTPSHTRTALRSPFPLSEAFQLTSKVVGIPNFRPAITYIVAQKRNNLRFLPSQGDRNVQPGTIVDKDVTHPFFFDFYMGSYNVPLGTIVDKDVTHPFFFYSYMVSHKGLLVMAPVFYVHLAATHCRNYFDHDHDATDLSPSSPLPHACTMIPCSSAPISLCPCVPVSLPVAPVFYAHLAATHCCNHFDHDHDHDATDLSSESMSPVFYAHLAATHCRNHFDHDHDHDATDFSSESSAGRNRDPAAPRPPPPPVPELPALAQSMPTRMFYC
ncbi:unnamed protein product [Closterium sp. NIES-64]|nr:unnamed protein product [Closterium sp. NIES-64]